MFKLYILTLLIMGVLLLKVPLVHGGTKSCDKRVNNTHNKLLECVTLDGVRAHQAVFQQIADSNGGNRLAGTPGHDESVSYVAMSLEDAGYDVTVQPFEYNSFINYGSSLEQISPNLTIYTENSDFDIMTNTAAGDILARVMAVDLDLGLNNSSSSGCEMADFAAFMPGKIALIQRGACSFQLKVDNAETAGAVGVIIFNQGNAASRLGLINGTLGSYTGNLPVIGATYGLGEEFATTVGLELRLNADVFNGLLTSYNVLAETKKGDVSNVVMAGAHLDSVLAGPGIQDNGSGSAALLETALKMAKVKTRNKLRFAWWGAEEAGLIGSSHYVQSLNEQQINNIALYLNFDMIGSPNHVYFIYDGDDSDGFGTGPGPLGSAQIERLFEIYYNAKGLPFKGTAFSGRSDYGPFISVGIPSGGLFTGAEGIKTSEEVILWGGTAGEQYDPCYHLACDTFDNINLEALEVNADALAFVVLQFAMDTHIINDKKGKGNFKRTYEMDYLGSHLKQ